LTEDFLAPIIFLYLESELLPVLFLVRETLGKKYHRIHNSLGEEMLHVPWTHS